MPTVFFLPDWAGINVILEIPDEYGELFVEVDPTNDMLIQFEQNPPKTRQIRPFSFFKIKDEERKKEITLFEKDPLILKVRYTPQAWESSSKTGGGQPRIFYRIYANNQWEEDWEAIDPIQILPPGTVDQFGYVIAGFPEVPDPAIGGC